MKTKVVILFLLFFAQFSFGQIGLRKNLHGQVVNDSLRVDNGYVFNINAKTRTYIGSDGFFDISAKAKDTLLISSLAFKSKRVILTQENLSFPLLVVKLQLFENKLSEVVIPNRKDLNPIPANTQGVVDREYFDDSKSSPKNTTMHPHSIENGMDFVRIFKDVSKLFKKQSPEVIARQDFQEYATNSLEPYFFTDILKLRDDEIGLFLIFCEIDPKSKTLMNPEDKFQLIDFLITKNDEFKRITTFEK
ncbi:hypothetical protein [Flavobacterium maritimum]|uniref:hypothetical protein n=1 Tax=Flavobacterium maritimum TaxID=3149042 RepID=UPI0032B5E808